VAAASDNLIGGGEAMILNQRGDENLLIYLRDPPEVECIGKGRARRLLGLSLICWREGLAPTTR
jgi:hypothetical protein